MLSKSFARAAVFTTLSAAWLAPSPAHAQGAPPTGPQAKPADAGNKQPDKPKAPKGGDAPTPAPAAAEATGGEPKDPSAVEGDAASATTEPVEGDAKTVEPPPTDGDASDDDDDDDDVWGEAVSDDHADTYQPPMVEADFSQPQLPGYTHEKHHMHRWVWHNLFAARLNPLGLTNRFRTGYQMQLSNKPEPIFHESFASLQLDTEITPSFGYVGGRLEIQPVKILNFWASYGAIGTFGTFNYTTSFADATAEHSDDDLDGYREECNPATPSSPCQYTTYGNQAILSGLFQVGIGGLVIRDNVKGTWMSMKLTDGDQVFWHATLDVLVPNSGWVVTNDADLLLITDWEDDWNWPGKLIVGLRHTLTHAIYRSEHLGGNDNPNTPTHRMGPAILYELWDDGPGTDLNKPTIIVLSQWWLKHRYRTSQSPALPYLVLGLKMEGDFLVTDKE